MKTRRHGLILRHYGYDVADAPTGEEAVSATRRLHPDIVLMDIGLPGIDGWEASQILKSDPLTLAIPLVAFSARVTSTDDLVGRSSCFDGFILKPISPTHLVNRVDAYLHLRRDSQDAFGPDALRRRVRLRKAKDERLSRRQEATGESREPKRRPTTRKVEVAHLEPGITTSPRLRTATRSALPIASRLFNMNAAFIDEILDRLRSPFRSGGSVARETGVGTVRGSTGANTTAT
jgi:DNA-binding response OmpR family regulator